MTSPQANAHHPVNATNGNDNNNATPLENLQDRESPETMDHTITDTPQTAVIATDRDENMVLQTTQPAQNFEAGYASIATDPNEIEPMPNHLGVPFQMSNMGMGNMGMDVYPGPDQFAMNNHNMDMSAAYIPNMGYQAFQDSPVQFRHSPVAAFARLEFPDTTLFLNTLSVILGRDLYAQKETQRLWDKYLKEQAKESEAQKPQTPSLRRQKNKYELSIVSENGGILRNEGHLGVDNRRRNGKPPKASKKSKSVGSAYSRRNSLNHASDQQQAEILDNSQEDDRVALVDPATLRPDINACPRLGIHPPIPEDYDGNPAPLFKAISREHLKIAYNRKKQRWEATVLGRNGVFVDEDLHHYGEVVPLKKGTKLQIGNIEFIFIPYEEDGCGEDDDGESAGTNSTVGNPPVHGRRRVGGKEMSFDFEDPLEGAPIQDTSEEEDELQSLSGDERSEDDERKIIEPTDFFDVASDDGYMAEEQDEQNLAMLRDEEEEGDNENDEPQEDQADDQVDDQDEDDGAEHGMPESNTKAGKKRKPGRPPKNGFMSKREEKEAKKAAQKQAKKTIPEKSTSGTGKTPAKTKVGRPRKDSQEEAPPETKEKRKYTKRKPKDPNSPTVKEEPGSNGESKPSKEKKEKKSAKADRSPSPTYNIDELTEEQLAKPTANYVSLIYEALSNSPDGAMGLSQIYRAIQRRYPWFVVRATTNGWQSSVRHNLQQHDAFRKVDREGKGWKWAIVEGVSIEKEKKPQRHPSPPMGHGQFNHPAYQAGVMHGPGSMGTPGSYPPPYYGQGLPSYPYHPHGYGGPGGQAQLVPPQNGSYSSPYAPKPPISQQPPPHQQTSYQRPPPGASQAFVPQPQRQQIPQQPQKPLSEADNRAIEVFKTRMVDGLKKKTDKAEVIVQSAINRVLGRSHAPVFPNSSEMEDGIMEALRNFLSKMGNTTDGAKKPPAQNRPAHPTPIVRPSYMGPSRANGIPRPPIMTPGASRPSSNSAGINSPQLPPATASVSPPIPAPMSISPPNTSALPQPTMNTNFTSSVASGSVPTTTQPIPQIINTGSTPNGNQSPQQPPGTAQIAGSKRPLEESEDLPNPKRLSVSLPSNVSIPVTSEEKKLQVQSSLTPIKSEPSLGDSEHYKGLSTTGPSPMKT